MHLALFGIILEDEGQEKFSKENMNVVPQIEEIRDKESPESVKNVQNPIGFP